MVTLKLRLGAQARVPSGLAGWVTSGLMLLAGPSGCFHEPVAERLELQPDDVLLDVACGSGLFLRRRASHVHQVAGIDLSGIQIRLARWILQQRLRAGTAELVEGDAATMPWPDDRFSAVACNCMDCIMDAEGPIEEMHRVLRPGGRLVLAAGSVSSPTDDRGQADAWGWRGWTEPELAALLEQAGFVDVTLSHDSKATFATARKPA